MINCGHRAAQSLARAYRYPVRVQFAHTPRKTSELNGPRQIWRASVLAEGE